MLMAHSGKKTENGRLYFGDKTADYLKRKSRAAVEKYNNFPILFFGIDWTNSKRNFYGEMLIKKFIHPKGVPLKGSYKVSQNADELQHGIPNKTMMLIVSVYDEHLKELNINPQQGDYFSIGDRYYQIYSRSMSDIGPGSLMLNRGKVRRDFFCYEEDDEVIQKNPYADDLGQESQINPETDLL